MSEPNDINKIFIEDSLTVTPTSMTLLGFSDGKQMDKATYSLVEGYVNVINPVEDFLSVYYFKGEDNYYEFRIRLTTESTSISGKDRFSNTVQGLESNTVMIFVDGIKLSEGNGEYDIDSDTCVILNKQIQDNDYHTVTIHVCSGATYMGNITDNSSWNATAQTIVIQDVTLNRYAFFMNGKLMNKNTISFTPSTGKVQFHTTIVNGSDSIEYYRFAENTINLNFAADPGFYSYGPKDDNNISVPLVYDALATFGTHIARLAVDDLRSGFFIREVDSNGCLMIIDTDFEKQSVKCLQVTAFSKTELTNTQFYLQVPDAKSITYYVSQFDLSQTLLPELLGTFQSLLLDETYDSIQRIRNLRSLTKVDSTHINQLIEFLGFKLHLTDMNLEQKHELLEELNNFYRIVGTESSYNFFNAISKYSKIVDIEQLFTPIKDNITASVWKPNVNYTASKSNLVTYDSVVYYCTVTHISRETFDATEASYWQRTSDGAKEKRYVTFYTAKELGAEYKRKYEFPSTDYGEVGQLANATDILSNQPHELGTVSDPSRYLYCYCDKKNVPLISEYGEWNSFTNTTSGPEATVVDIVANPLTTSSTVGPNTATTDYGRVCDFEYEVDLKQGYTMIEGEDIYGETLSDLNTSTSKVFIHGKQLNAGTDYNVISSNMLVILGKYFEKEQFLMQARTFIPSNSTSGYADYYYTNGDDPEDNNVYNIKGEIVYGLGNYQNYPILWKTSGENTIYYHQISTVEVEIGRGKRDGSKDTYIHTTNIEKKYSKVLEAFTGDIYTEQDVNVTDYSYILTRGDAKIIKYLGSDITTQVPNISKQDTTWYINLEDQDDTIEQSTSVFAYKVYYANGERVYDTNLNTPVIGLLNLNTTEISFISKVGSTVTTYGSATRNQDADIKTAATPRLTKVIIYKDSMTPTDIQDDGYVYEAVKGEWIEWFEWDRPTNWYPTNHVNVSVEVPAQIDYETFMSEFKKTFYNIASTVLYIHNIINVYTFGYSKNSFGILTAPTYHTIEYSLSNNPSIQPPIV